MKRLSFLIFISLLFTAQEPAWAKNICQTFYANLERAGKNPVFFEDAVIQDLLSGVNSSYVFFGQKPLQVTARNKAVEGLSGKNGLTAENIRRVHRELSGGKAKLEFRSTSEAKELGPVSFRAFHSLNAEEIKAVEANPFLRWVDRTDVADVKGITGRYTMGDIVYPNAEDISKFEELLSPETLKKVSAYKKKKSPAGEKAANHAILDDLLNWSLAEAERQVKAKAPAHKILGELEWRLRSLGLYYEQPFKISGRSIEWSISGINANRSSELAEAVTDAFARSHGLIKGDLPARIYRPKLTDSEAVWVAYMKDAAAGDAPENLKKITAGLEKAAKKMKDAERGLFETYFATRIMTGTGMNGATAESILKDFRAYQKTHHSRKIPEAGRATLIPIEFIQDFGQIPKSFDEYLDTNYLRDSTLFRGVSTPWKLTDKQVMEYFKSYKGRLASELGRTVFAERLQMSKLAMLRYNAELIEGKVVDEALEHAAKHAGFEPPNSARTYFTSMTDHDTIAFRFAVDKGYVTESSSAVAGNTHIVIESYRPKAGMVDFSEFRNTDPNWRNFYPRQRETAIAGGIDPNSVKKIYLVEPYKKNEKPPAVGPEKHGRIIRIFERDERDPRKIWVLERNKNGEWEKISSESLK